MDERAKFVSLMLFLLGCSSLSFVAGLSRYGDILVYEKNGTIHCDKIICPPNAVQCKVRKDTDPRNRSIIIRQNKCLDSNGKELTSKITEEPNPDPDQDVHIEVTEGSGANIISSGSNVQFPPGFPFHNGGFPKPPHFPPGFPFQNGGFPKPPVFPPGFPFHNGGAPRFPKFPAGFPFYDDGDNDSDFDSDNDD